MREDGREGEGVRGCEGVWKERMGEGGCVTGDVTGDVTG